MSRIRANQFTDKAGTGAPTFPNGVQITGVSTLGNTVVGGGTTQLVVTGNARITGILTIGTSSITLDGSSNQVNVGTGVTLHHTNGVQVGGNNLHSTVLTVNNINASGVVTVTTLNATSIVGVTTAGITTAYIGAVNDGPISGTRNRIINGAMEIAQRGTSHTANGYTLDRWIVYNSGGTFTLSQQTAASGSQPENGMTKFLRIARTSPSGIFYLSQKIEDVSLYDGFAVTVSFYAKANTNITLPVRLIQEFGSGGSTAVTVGTVNTSVTSSWAKYTATFTLPSLSGKTVGTSSFLELAFDTPATYSTLDITGVQLEAGSVATPFERRNYGQELALCQRYFQVLDLTKKVIMGNGSTGLNCEASFTLPMTMRTTPTSISEGATITARLDGGAGTVTGKSLFAVDSSNISIFITITGSSYSNSKLIGAGTALINAEL